MACLFLANQINPILTLIGQGLTQHVLRTQMFGAEKIIAYYQEQVARLEMEMRNLRTEQESMKRTPAARQPV